MMEIDTKELSKEYIQKQIEDLNSRIITLENKSFKKYVLDDFRTMTSDELVALFNLNNQNGIVNSEENAGIIKNYFDTLDRLNTYGTVNYYQRTLDNMLQFINTIIADLNKIINELIMERDIQITFLKKELNVFRKLNDYLYVNEESTIHDYLEIADFINGLDLFDSVKFELSYFVARELINNVKQFKVQFTDESIDKFEEDVKKSAESVEIKISNSIDEQMDEQKSEEQNIEISDERKKKINFANAMLSKFLSPSSKHCLNPLINPDSDCLPISGIVGLIHEEGYSKDIFAFLVMALVANIKDLRLSDDDSLKYVQKLETLNALYDEYIVKREERKTMLLEKAKNFESDLKELFAVKNVGDRSKIIADLQEKVIHLNTRIENNILISDEFRDIEEKISDVNNKIILLMEELGLNDTYGQNEVVQKVPIKSFVMFATDSDGTPYIFKDLFGKNSLIDEKSVTGNVSNKADNYQKSISKLINDLFILGDSQYTFSDVSSASTNSQKFVDQVCYPDRNGTADRTKKTDMWRIRPDSTSNVRLVERKIVLEPDTILYKQVKDIIQKHLPNIQFPENEKFELYINICTGVKKVDTALYSTSIARHDIGGIGILKLFYVDERYSKKYSTQKAVRLKEKFSDEELRLFEEYVVNSLQVFNELHKKDEKYDFSFIDEMGGVSKYGLH